MEITISNIRGELIMGLLDWNPAEKSDSHIEACHDRKGILLFVLVILTVMQELSQKIV